MSHTHHKADALQERFWDRQHKIIFEDQQKRHIQSILYRNFTSLAAQRWLMSGKLSGCSRTQTDF